VAGYSRCGCVDNVMMAKRKQLLQWCAWFFAGNTLLFWLVGLRYMHAIPWMNDGVLSFTGKIILGVFFTISYLGQLGFLACIPAFWIVLFILIFPRRNFILPIAALSSGLWLIVLITDIAIYSSYRFHVNGILLSLILHSFSQPIFDLSAAEIIVAAVIIFTVLMGEIIFASFVWWRLEKQASKINVSKWLAIIVFGCLYFSYSMFVLSSDSKGARIVLDSTRSLPFYTEFLGAILPIKNGQVALERTFERYLLQPSTINEPLNYPLQQLQFHAAKQKLNLLVIVIDTWRFDMLTPEVTPNVYQFAQQSTVFQHHFSGGDATGPGIFSLFYGIPSVYWSAMEEHHRGPLLIDELIKRHYQPEILASGELFEPAFNRTVFSAIKNLSVTTPGATPYDRDVRITQTFTDFIQHQKKPSPPFFGFLFYDAAHSYCAVPNNLVPFHPVAKICNRMSLSQATDPEPYFNRYKNSLLLVDEEIGQVLQLLKDHHLLDNTVVLITGDHGEEFNDNHLGYWGHASNFTHYQVQTPLILYWPHTPPKKISYMTTHYDIAPTLMTQLLGCTTLPDQYSDGVSLFQSKPISYLLVGSYIGFGIIEKDRITSIFPSGNFQITQPNGQLTHDTELRLPVMQSALRDMRKFYQS